MAVVADSIRQLAAPESRNWYSLVNAEQALRIIDELLAVASISQGCSSMWQPC
jgi:(2Fe-2S) ferredoxin